MSSSFLSYFVCLYVHYVPKYLISSRSDQEIYWEMFYDWDSIMKEREEELKLEEYERNERKSSKLNETWELIRVYKKFLEKWKNEWVEGSMKAEEKKKNLKRWKELKNRGFSYLAKQELSFAKLIL